MRATDAELAENPEQFDCATCEYKQQSDALTEEDRLYITAYELLARRVVREFHLVPLVFDALGLRMSRPTILRFIEALEVLHEHRAPLTPATSPEGQP